jgi:hypothetical protein
MTATDGRLFEYFDEHMNSMGTVSIAEYVDSWNRGVAYGSEAVVAS